MPDHVPVLLSEVLSALQLRPNEHVIDATLGGGGHAQAMLEAISPSGRLMGLEADWRTLQQTQTALTKHGSRFVAVHGNFRDLRRLAMERHFENTNAILFDLGLSSIALTDPSRGFSFQHDGPLDMRFDPSSQTLTAADVVNQQSAEDLTVTFRRYGDEPLAERIAAHLVDVRRQTPFRTTTQLSTAIEHVKHRRGRIHPATQIFQALRIAVNDEAGALHDALPQALELLAMHGRLAVITFHSGEDRLVKQWMKSVAAEHLITIVTKHVIKPTREEQLINPRARSAHLRLCIKK